VTKAPAKKEWTRPELIRLGTIADVAGATEGKSQGNFFQKS